MPPRQRPPAAEQQLQSPVGAELREAPTRQRNYTGPDLAAGSRSNYRELLAEGSFFRFFIGQVASSFGDWVGLLAILALVKRIYDNEFAVAAVLFARLAPALFFGPVAGVLVDRWDRKKVMVGCDLARAGLILILPFLGSISARVPVLTPVLMLFVISALLEMLTLLWQPAKDSCVPEMVRDPGRYTHAYSLLLIGAYATFPLSGAAFGLLTQLSQFLGRVFESTAFIVNRELLALFFDSFTFLVSAALTMTLRISTRDSTKRRLDVKVIWADLREGLRFLRQHRMISSWVIGIGGTFAGIGVFLSVALFFVAEVLGGGSGGFGLLVTAVGSGLGAGFLMAGAVARVIPKDILFSSVVVGLGASMVGFGSTSTLTAGLVFGGVCGLFAGFAYPTGYALVQENLAPELRGRATAAVNTLIRLAVLGSSAVAPAVVRVIDLVAPRRVAILQELVDLRGVRVVMWLGGLTIFGAGIYTIRAVRARRGLAIATPGVFLVFEGGEGAGKTTQIDLLAQYLKSQGRRVVVTREPGGTQLGQRIRDILLDPSSDSISSKTEALLYAADRAQHVDEEILPALASGAIVVSDRYIDSSIAYQGAARGLGIEEIASLNRWATGGLIPDLVFFFDVDAEKGLARSGLTDRIEQQGLEFHEKVREAYRLLAGRYAERFVILDASKPPEVIASEICRRVVPLLDRDQELSSPRPPSSGSPAAQEGEPGREREVTT